MSMRGRGGRGSVCVEHVIMGTGEGVRAVVSQAFCCYRRACWPGTWNVLVVTKHLHGRLKGSAVRNKHHGFAVGAWGKRTCALLVLTVGVYS